jgi:hypothetical protein
MATSVAPESGRNRIMIYGPKSDGTYIVEFKTADFFSAQGCAKNRDVQVFASGRGHGSNPCRGRARRLERSISLPLAQSTGRRRVRWTDPLLAQWTGHRQVRWPAPHLGRSTRNHPAQSSFEYNCATLERLHSIGTK